MANLRPYLTLISGLVVVGAIVAVGAAKTAGIIDGDTYSTAISYILGLLTSFGVVAFGKKQE